MDIAVRKKNEFPIFVLLYVFCFQSHSFKLLLVFYSEIILVNYQVLLSVKTEKKKKKHCCLLLFIQSIFIFQVFKVFDFGKASSATCTII